MISNIGLVVLSIAIISLIFYLKKTENFTNLREKKQSRLKNYGPSVRTYKGPGIAAEPGPLGSLNLSSVQSSFPYTSKNNRTGDMDPGDINLIKSDGVILGGYRHQIIRPMDNVTANPKKGSDCQWPCFSDRKHQQWCSEENAIKYHAMRPIMQPDTYNNNLKKMFSKMIDVKTQIPFDDLFEEVDVAVFCTESQKSLMSWLMKKIALTVDKMPEMQKNGSWKTERFYEMDVQMYEYRKDNSVYFKILFNLYNPLRSVATWVVATVYLQTDKDSTLPKLVNMDFVNEGKMTDYMEPQNGYGAITGQNLPGPSKYGVGIENFVPLGVPNSPEGLSQWKEEYKKNPNEFDWNYQNTLEVKKFNNKGFHSNIKDENIEIIGGVPESLKNKLRDPNNSCNSEQLMSCAVPRFTGISTANKRPTVTDGTVKNVYNNPILTYESSNEVGMRPIETANGLVYI
jgi:hypothetical protein